MKRLLLATLILVLFVVGVLIVNPLLARSRQYPSVGETPLAINSEAAVAHLQAAVRIPTVSHQDWSAVDTGQFAAFHAFLERSYPKAHRVLDKEVVNGYALLYRWKGLDTGRKPILLLAHQDVVPVRAEAWTYPPFSGELAEGYIWGRGTLDDKGSLLGIFEAVEALLAEGFTPQRDIYIASGHDEEVGGRRGAGEIAALLASRGIGFEFSLDEGLVVADGMIPGLSQPAALIGLTEKGYLTLELTAKGMGGHSSQPPAQTTLGILAAAVVRLEEHPFPGALQGPIKQMFSWLAPEMRLPMRFIFSNLWLFKPLVTWQLAAAPGTNAALRTTTAVTIMAGGEKENVLPSEARALVNFRILPGDTIDGVIERVRAVIDDERITIRALENQNEASPVSDVDSPSFALIARTARQIFPGAVVAPGMMMAGSDSHHYTGVAEQVYRFLPVQMTAEDVARIHGANERISPENHLRAIRFYAQLIRNASGFSE